MGRVRGRRAEARSGGRGTRARPRAEARSGGRGAGAGGRESAEARAGACACGRKRAPARARGRGAGRRRVAREAMIRDFARVRRRRHTAGRSIQPAAVASATHRTRGVTCRRLRQACRATRAPAMRDAPASGPGRPHESSPVRRVVARGTAGGGWGAALPSRRSRPSRRDRPAAAPTAAGPGGRPATTARQTPGPAILTGPWPSSRRRRRPPTLAPRPRGPGQASPATRGGTTSG